MTARPDLPDTMSAQDVFDTVVAHLRAQGRRAFDEARENEPGGSGGCFYRLQVDGATLKCAAGCLIRDDEYRFGMEGLSIGGLIASSGSSLYNRLDPYRGLLASLQCVHDRFQPDSWEEQLAATASSFNLSYTPPPPVAESKVQDS